MLLIVSYLVLLAFLFFLLFRYKNQRGLFFRNRNSLIWLTVFVLSSAYIVKVHGKYSMLAKLSMFASDMDGIFVAYSTENGELPQDIGDLDSNWVYSEKLRGRFYPFSPPQLSLHVHSRTDSSYSYTLCFPGFDKDDDYPERSYPLNASFAFNPFFDGDFIIYDITVRKE